MIQDCHNRNYLFIKLEKYGVLGSALERFRSHFSRRQHKFKIVTSSEIMKFNRKESYDIGLIFYIHE